ncbi:MAG: hypothetical protein GY774_35210 [Planctomycetes bacterium]|nr:hypothetical protein [Planctomycetota bacterium]
MQHPTDFTGALRILATALLRADIATQQRFVEAETEYTVTETGSGLVIDGSDTPLDISVLIQQEFDGADGKTLERLFTDWTGITAVYEGDSSFLLYSEEEDAFTPPAAHFPIDDDVWEDIKDDFPTDDDVDALMTFARCLSRAAIIVTKSASYRVASFDLPTLTVAAVNEDTGEDVNLSATDLSGNCDVFTLAPIYRTLPRS